MKFSPLRLALAAIVSTGILAATAGTASAAGLTADAGACADNASAKVFSPWLDPASYFLAPNGDFEEGTSQWTVSGGARVVNDQEPWKITSKDDSSALELPAGASAVSGVVCAGLQEPTVRMFAKSNGTLLISVRTKLLTGTPVQIPIGASVGPVWKPTLASAMIVNALGVDTKAPVQIVVTSIGGTSRVDDVYVDPWRAR